MQNKNKVVFIRDLGEVDYKKTWDYQEELLQRSVAVKTYNRKHPDAEKSTSNYFLFCEHPPVFTLGKSGKVEHLLLTPEQLKAQGISYYHINRGGDITYHGPGQLVGYPILDLENFKPDLHWYLRGLEESCIEMLAEYGLESGRIDGLTGVWLGIGTKHPRKIMAIGIRCSRWITMHGFALNVNAHLPHFNHIIPCGITDKAVTSMKEELGRALDMKLVQRQLMEKLQNFFGFEWSKWSESVESTETEIK